VKKSSDSCLAFRTLFIGTANKALLARCCVAH